MAWKWEWLRKSQQEINMSLECIHRSQLLKKKTFEFNIWSFVVTRNGLNDKSWKNMIKASILDHLFLQ